MKSISLDCGGDSHIFVWKSLKNFKYFPTQIHGWETAGCSRHAGQSNFPRIVCRPIRLAWKKLRGFVTKRAQETCFVSPWRKAIFPMDSPLSQHKKWSLLSDVCYFLFALVNYSVSVCDPYTNRLLPMSLKIGSQSKSTTLCRKRPTSKGQWIQRLTSYNGALIWHCVGLLVWKLLFLSLR